MALLNKLEASVLCVWLIAVGGWSSAAVVRANAPLPDCTPALITLEGCIEFVTGKATTPSESCCSSVSDVHQSNPTCLCVLSEDDTTTRLIPGFRADLAGELPNLCKLQGLSKSECPALLGENATAPALSPVRRVTVGSIDNIEGAVAPSSRYPGAGYRLKTSDNLIGFIFTYLGMILASSAVISCSKY